MINTQGAIRIGRPAYPGERGLENPEKKTVLLYNTYFYGRGGESRFIWTSIMDDIPKSN